jgi:hypothetical protein
MNKHQKIENCHKSIIRWHILTSCEDLYKKQDQNLTLEKWNSSEDVDLDGTQQKNSRDF